MNRYEQVESWNIWTHAARECGSLGGAEKSSTSVPRFFGDLAVWSHCSWQCASRNVVCIDIDLLIAWFNFIPFQDLPSPSTKALSPKTVSALWLGQALESCSKRWLQIPRPPSYRWSQFNFEKKTQAVHQNNTKMEAKRSKGTKAKRKQ